MKNLTNYIFEKLVINKTSSYMGPDGDLKTTETLLHFSSGAALFMFDAEMKGQISDGKYENSRPFGHYKWVGSTQYTIDGNEYHSNFGHEKQYNLNEWVRAVKSILKTGTTSDGQYDFAIRLYYYGKFAHIIGDKAMYDLYKKKKLYGLRGLVENMGTCIAANMSFDEFLDDCNKKPWLQHYMQDAKQYITEDIYNEFKNYDYSFNDFKTDVKSMEASVNTYQHE